ncbi:MAG: hypothetical protein LPK25_09465 [Cyclobacteriaceae bacterium]|nr:hypothetical protein [Cyclobacteriaceae bacterium]MDX5466829.1 hypothetical protein [Cyclobacteriaceae bacterium]
MKNLLFSILLWWLTIFPCLSQDKVEVEVRVRKEMVPQNAIEQVNYLFEKGIKNLKWYQETTGDKISFEAKFKFDRQFYSVEFDTLGRLEDIEIEISIDQIPDESRKNLTAYLEGEFQECTIFKIQRQLTGEIESLKKYLERDSDKEVTIHYEIVLAGKAEEWDAWELLADSQGRFISIQKVLLKRFDNLIF